MLLSYNELVKLVDAGVITADYENINAASIDLTLDDVIMIEDEPKFNAVVSLKDKESISMREVKLGENGYILAPGEFVLASTREVFNLPDDLCCEYKLKSTLARNGLGHLLAGWADCGFNSAKLTLELKNETRKHELTLKPGMKIGQMVWFRCEPVPANKSYRAIGQYNGQTQVTASKGLR